jgi:hypothetical protein
MSIDLKNLYHGQLVIVGIAGASIEGRVRKEKEES